MRAMSFLRAWIYGIGLFTALTLSLALAFAIAITGPPTRSEMESVQHFLSAVARDLEPVVGQAGAELCVQLPPDVTGSLCPERAVAETPAAEPVAYEEERAETPPLPEIAARDERVAHEPLLGAAESASPRRVESVRAQQRPERRARVTAVRERRAVRPPIVSPRNEPTPQIEEVGERALADLEAMTSQEIAAREFPSQNDASPAEEYSDEETYEDEPYYEEEAAYEEARAYEEEQRWREERRRYRQWRRRQAYYEREERSGGW